MSEQDKEEKKEETTEVETGPVYSMQAKNMATKILATIEVMARCSPDVSAEIIELVHDAMESCKANDIDLLNAFINRLTLLEGGGE
jgi:hypothetical protein